MPAKPSSSPCSSSILVALSLSLAAAACGPSLAGVGTLRGSVGYEIFVRSFADSNGDGSGDLRGVIQRLDYLAQLGVDVLWLTPIFPSPSYHGYDVTDYESIHPQLGDRAIFDQLVRAAHRHHMRVLLDVTCNHTSAQHPWFLAATADPGSPDAGRYLLRDDNPGWPSPLHPADPHPPLLFKALPGAAPARFYYSIFSAGLPDLNFRDPRIPSYFAGLLGRWLGRGADGFRLDAARYLVESPDPRTAERPPAVADTAATHQVWRRLRAALRPGTVLLGEVWADTRTIASYAGDQRGAELTSAFAFPLAGATLDAVRRGLAQPLQDTLNDELRSGAASGFFTPFLSNHDQVRTATVLHDDPARLRLAAALLLAMPGAPFLYYGEEIGLGQSQAAGDQAKRAAMPWEQVARQQADPGSLWSWYRQLIAARRRSPALQDDRLEVVRALANGAALPPALLIMIRGEVQGRVLALYNLGGVPLPGVQIALPAEWPTGAPGDLLKTTGETALPVLTAANRAAYPLPDLPPRSALWLAAPPASPGAAQERPGRVRLNRRWSVL